MTMFTVALLALSTTTLVAAAAKLAHIHITAERSIMLRRRIQGRRPAPSMERVCVPVYINN